MNEEMNEYSTPTFQESIKGYVLDLIDAIPRVSEDLVKQRNSNIEISKVEGFKRTFYKCFLLTKSRITNEELLFQIDEWLKADNLDKGDTRKQVVESGIVIAKEYLDELDKVGIIDFVGREHKHFPFIQIIQDHEEFKDTKNVSETHKQLINQLFKSNLHKEILKRLSVVINKIEKNDQRISLQSLENMIMTCINESLSLEEEILILDEGDYPKEWETEEDIAEFGGVV